MQGHVDHGVERRPPPEWIASPERSNVTALRCIVWIALTLGRRAARLLLYPVCLYYLISCLQARLASRKYLRKALAREPLPADYFRHFHTFAATLLDRVFLLNDQYAQFDVRVHGEDIVLEMAQRGEGCLLLGAHVGSFEMVRAVGKKNPGVRVSMVMYEDNGRNFHSVLGAINPKLSLQVIALGKVDSMLRVETALKQGEFVGMLGDRTIQGEGTVACQFLGEPAQFPIGPFRMAAILRRPIVLMFSLYRGGNRYDIHFERLVGTEQAARAQRDLLVEPSLRRYVERLEHYCRSAPSNWFNFYDFWRAP